MLPIVLKCAARGLCLNKVNLHLTIFLLSRALWGFQSWRPCKSARMLMLSFTSASCTKDISFSWGSFCKIHFKPQFSRSPYKIKLGETWEIFLQNSISLFQSLPLEQCKWCILNGQTLLLFQCLFVCLFIPRLSGRNDHSRRLPDR